MRLVNQAIQAAKQAGLGVNIGQRGSQWRQRNFSTHLQAEIQTPPLAVDGNVLELNPRW
ncbi:hypothetical protein D3C76_1794760 [compost metagenome]